MNPYRTQPAMQIRIEKDPRPGNRAIFIVFMVLTLGGLFACPQTPEAKTTEKAVVKVADDTCREIADAGLAPEWVALICDTAAGAVNVLLPRQEWHAIKMRRMGSIDAGPGK